MSILAKIVTSVFGTKSDKDLKQINPFVEEINTSYESLNNLTDNELRDKFTNIKTGLNKLIEINKADYKNQNKDDSEIDDLLYKDETEYLNENMVDVFAIVKDAARRLGSEYEKR